MAKENDEVPAQNLSGCSDEGAGDNGTAASSNSVNKSFEDEASLNSSNTNSSQPGAVNCSRGARGNLNDLVADLVVNGNCGNSSFGYSDYQRGRNIETSFGDAVSSTTDLPSSSTPAAVTTSSSSTFSFKHFLNSSGSAPTAPSSTVTSLNAPTFQASGCSSSSSAQSTGARPKVPQSASSGNSTISSLISGSAQESSTSKMKRSPKFSSFDSQASLAEYAGVGEKGSCANGHSSTQQTNERNSGGFRLYTDGEARDFFSCRNSGAAAATGGFNSNYDGKYVPRSYSNYDMPPTASPRRRGLNSSLTSAATSSSSKESRPNRLTLNMNTPKLRLDLPLDTAAVSGSSPAAQNAEFSPAVAAALPDFVQDHWMDSWYSSPIHLNSPPNSPLFVDEPQQPASLNASLSQASLSLNTAGEGNVSNNNSANTTSKMLPDFLSDGPIIHSSQRMAQAERMADVAAGLPDSVDSPEESAAAAATAAQLTRLRLENERLLRELAQSSSLLNEQTRRGNDLERQLLMAQQRSSFQRNLDEELDCSRTAEQSRQQTVQINKLRQQVAELKSEIDMVRQENAALREEGAVGGCAVGSSPGCSSSSATKHFANSASAGGAAPSSSTSTAEAAAASSSSSTTARQRSLRRNQQYSRELLRAAANAESNLRQLLTGVDNLRQMAAEMDNSQIRHDYDVSPDLFSEFLDGDECDDYEEYPPGGPAL